jgi:hypothetical protein
LEVPAKDSVNFDKRQSPAKRLAKRYATRIQRATTRVQVGNLHFFLCFLEKTLFKRTSRGVEGWLRSEATADRHLPEGELVFGELYGVGIS